jgi:hypothetical protein
MSADQLRRAAAELRDAATHVPPSPWEVHESPGGSALAVISTAPSERVSSRSGKILKRATTQVAISPVRRGHRQNIAYIAKLHPDVALAMADLLEITADVMGWLGPPIVLETDDGDFLADGMGIPRIEWDRAVTLAEVILSEVTDVE